MSMDASTLTELLDNEIIKSMGLSPAGWPGSSLHPVLRRATRRFSEIFAAGDRIVGEQGLPAGADFLLSKLVSGLEVRGAENIPRDGPLVIASNHPGTVDSTALVAAARRPDVKMVAGAVPFLQLIPNVSRHLIFTSYDDPHIKAEDDPHFKMVALRKSLQHLLDGGTLLLFPGTWKRPPMVRPAANDDIIEGEFRREPEAPSGNLPRRDI